MRQDFAAGLASVIAGGAIWGWVAVSSGRAEPWDAPQFWTLAYPAALGVCAVFGFVWPQRPWRWALIVFAMLLAVMSAGGAAAGSSFSMMPLGIVALAVLGLPGVLLAALAGWVRRR